MFLIVEERGNIMKVTYASDTKLPDTKCLKLLDMSISVNRIRKWTILV